MNKLKVVIASVVLLWGGMTAKGFVLIGPMGADELTHPALGVDYNLTDDMGGPKELKQFFRWNVPYLTYSFDASFVRYFGLEGMQAVNDAFRVINDFFEPEDKSYSGVSSLEYVKHGFRSNFNTAWVNTTAQNQQLIDIKSLVLGMIVNQLGVGNPHRYAFSINNISTNTTSQWNFNVRLKNFDPLTWMPTDVINGVKYSYRLIHDALPSAGVGTGGTNTVPTLTDVEEFTTDVSGNAWTAVSGIMDSFYGNTALFWTDPPTLFNFGVYYDAQNAMGGQYQPRHALTYDDAAALKYLYRSNNIVLEGLPGIDTGNPVSLIQPAQFFQQNGVNTAPAQHFLNPLNHFVNTNLASARFPRTFPRRSTIGGTNISFAFPTTSPWRGLPVIAPGLTTFFAEAFRGGVERIQFYHIPFDSLIGLAFQRTNFMWTDVITWNGGFVVNGLNNTTPGASASFGRGPMNYYKQIVGRNVDGPDFLFSADELGVTAVDGVPIAWRRGTNVTTNFSAANFGGFSQRVTNNPAQNVGPGVMYVPPPAGGIPDPIEWTFAKMSDGFELIWSGEASVVGNQDTYSLWAHIKGPGPNDINIFPDNSMVWRLENVVRPDVAAPVVSMVSDSAGLAPIATNSYTRTQETITIMGSGLGSASAIEIMSGDRVLQTLFPIEKYVVNNTRLDIPPGILTEETEGVARQIRVWNSVGPSDKSPEIFNIYTGKAVVTATMKDKAFYDRGQSLRIFGYGFRSTQGRPADGNATATDIRVEDNQGNVVFPNDLNATRAVDLQIISDREAILPMNTLDSSSDGFWRRIRVSRGHASTLSPASNEYISLITGDPTVTAFTTIDLNGTETDINSTVAFRRDRGAEIRGTALNAVTEIRIERIDGTGAIAIQLNPFNDHADPARTTHEPYPGVIFNDDGTKIQISKDVFKGFANDWKTDGHTPDTRCVLKLSHLIKNYQSSANDRFFNVNVQPEITGLGGFTVANSFNRSPLEHLGDDVLLVGSGFLAVKEIRIVDENGADINGTPNIVFSSPGKTPGVAQTDTSIRIDTSVMQFNNAVNADSNRSHYHRRFRLVTDRDDRYTSQTSRFIIGVPPTYTALSGVDVNYSRDANATDFNGTGLSLLTKVEIVDINGNPIAAGTGIVPPILDEQNNLSPDLSGRSAIGFTIDANASTWVASGHYLDTSTLLSDGNGTRRIRVTTPFGIATSTPADAFTISALPDFLPAGANTSQTTFAGTTDGNASNADMDYNGSDTSTNVNGELIINGTNFRGLKTIELLDSTGSTVFSSITIDPLSPPAGFLINNLGTQLTITKAALDDANSTWLTSGSWTSRSVRLTSAGDQNATTPALNVTK